MSLCLVNYSAGAMNQTDTQLIAACRRGDEAAWETLVMRYQRLIYAIPVRSGMDDYQAAEVFQRVFTKLVEYLPRIEQPDRLQAWLVTTTKRETWRFSKQEQRTLSIPDLVDEEDGAGLMAETPLPDEVIQELEEQHLVRTALQEIDERCQNLLTLLFYRDGPPSYAEIAQKSGVPEGSIGPTRARCLQKLKKVLVEMGF